MGLMAKDFVTLVKAKFLTLTAYKHEPNTKQPTWNRKISDSKTAYVCELQ